MSGRVGVGGWGPGGRGREDSTVEGRGSKMMEMRDQGPLFQVKLSSK